MSIISQVGPLQWQVPIVDREGRPTPEFIRYFTQLFGNTTTLNGTKQDADDDLTALAALSTTGLVTRTGTTSYSTRTITAGTGISVSNGNGVSGNPVISSTIPIGGTFSVPLLANAMVPRTTNGAAAGSTETTTNKVMVSTLDFDAATNEYAQMTIPMPKSWDEGTLTVQFLWTASSGSGNVVWAVQAVALSDGDALDTAFGTAQTVTDTLIAVDDLHETSFTSAMTVAGSPVNNDLVCFQFYRDAVNGSDTLAVDAKLIAVRLMVTLNASDDS